MRVTQKSTSLRLLYWVPLGLWFVGLTLWAQETGTKSEYPQVPAKPGERCTVCRVLLSEEDVALIVRGRRVPLDKSMVPIFLANPEKYFAQQQPKGALFQEELAAPAGVAQGGISWVWFFFGLYVVLALICAGLSGYNAVSKGLPPIPNFFVGFFFSVLGLLYVLTRSPIASCDEIPAGLVKVPVTRSPLACPKCGNTNHPAARQCAACGGQLKPVLQSEAARV